MKFAPSPREHLNGQKFYRFADCPWSDQHVASEHIWYAVRETPKGYWLTDEYAIQEKFVLKDGKKRFAYPNRDQAFTAYIKRKEKQVSILTAQLYKAKQRLEATAKGIPAPIPPMEDQSGDFEF